MGQTWEKSKKMVGIQLSGTRIQSDALNIEGEEHKYHIDSEGSN